MTDRSGGCFKNLFAWVGFSTVGVLVLYGGWLYRDPLRDAYRAFQGEARAEEPADSGPGRPSEDALAAAREKQRRMARPGGPSLVTLDANEMASLIQDGLDPIGRQALDSLSVEFFDDRFVLQAQLVTDVWGKEQLGFFSGLLLPREPLRVAGPAHIARTGVLAWEPDELSVRSLPFPPAAIRPIVNSLTGGKDGTFLLAAPASVGDMRIRPTGVTFYRRER